MEIKLWILLPVLGASLTIVWWAFRTLVNGINSRLDRLIRQNEETGKELTRQNSEIGSLRSDMKDHKSRLDDHGKRIREIEIKQARWEN